MKKTINYKLNKPDYSDTVDIEMLNSNFDIIDKELKNSFDKVECKRKTYDELKQLVDSNQLKTGERYILTDYKTKYQQPTTNVIKEVGGEELILTALNSNTFEPIVFSLKYPSDTIWYDFNDNICEDKKTARNGFITRRYDQISKNNCPQDWRHMLWSRDGKEYLTFGERCECNYIGDIDELHNNIFGSNCYGNIFGSNCYGNIFGDNCCYNKFNNNCNINVFVESCYNNTFGNGCYQNTFGNGCRSNIFDNDCFKNTFGNGCYQNTFDNNCYKNTFGNDCCNNTFGNGCYVNKFGNSCVANILKNNCNNNTFGSDCCSNTLNPNSNNNTVGNEFKNLYIKRLERKNLTNITELQNKGYAITVEANKDFKFLYYYYDSSNQIIVRQIP